MTITYISYRRNSKKSQFNRNSRIFQKWPTKYIFVTSDSDSVIKTGLKCLFFVCIARYCGILQYIRIYHDILGDIIIYYHFMVYTHFFISIMMLSDSPCFFGFLISIIHPTLNFFYKNNLFLRWTVFRYIFLRTTYGIRSKST